MNVLRRKWQGLPRGVVVCITALVIYVPLLFIVVQSFLSAPFFSRSKSWSLEAFAFIFTDPDFYLALRSGFILAFGLVIIAIPLLSLIHICYPGSAHCRRPPTTDRSYRPRPG